MLFDRWFFRFLCFTLLYGTVWINPANASILKDIRVGEHANFTRIVFELDAAVDATVSEMPDSNQLRIDFPGTRPDLVRKIPLKRANRVEAIQIWDDKNLLSVNVKFIPLPSRVNTFTLKKPFRFTVDIFWAASPLSSLPTTQITNDPDDAQEAAAPPVASEHAPSESIDKAASDTVQQPQAPDAVSEEIISPKLVTPQAISQPQVSELSTGPSPPSALVPRPDAAAIPLNGGVPMKKNPLRSNWLQYYLAIALIALTIAILILLVLVLVAHYRWTYQKVAIDPNEYLQKQKNRIAELDEQIKEQLKRYDEV